MTPRTKAVFICTPHNPATTIVRRGPLERFLAALGDDPPLVVLDEAYRDFCDDPETPDGVALARARPTLISLRTFSKIAGLAGLRVGYAVAQPEVIDWLNRVRAPFNVNRFAQVGGAGGARGSPPTWSGRAPSSSPSGRGSSPSSAGAAPPSRRRRRTSSSCPRAPRRTRSARRC